MPIFDTPEAVDRSSLKREIRSLRAKAAKGDGEGAAALEDDAVKVALELVDAFPGYIENPDVGVSPHGEIDFDWMIDEDAMLTVSVLSSSEIGFAALLPDAKASGREPWSGTLPPFVHCCFERLKTRIVKASA